MLHYFPFPEARPGQMPIIEEIAHFDKKYAILNAPTGAGKSAVALTLARYFNDAFGRQTIIATSNKVLQDQYLEDFSDTAPLKGRDSFFCGQDSNRKASNCIGWERGSGYDPCRSCAACPYNIHIEGAYQERAIAVSNYHSLFFSLNKKRDLSSNKLLVIDECHMFPEFLKSIASIRIPYDMFIADQDFLSQIGRGISKKEVAKKLHAYVLTMVDEAMESRDFTTALEYSTSLQALSCMVQHPSDNIPWAFHEGNDLSICADCLEASAAWPLIESEFDRFVFMSATVNAQDFSKEMGFPEKDVTPLQMSPQIPLAMRPFLVIANKDSNMKFANKAGALKINAEKLLFLLDKFPNWKGIVHSHSFSNAWALRDHLRNLRPSVLHERDFFWHTKGKKEPLLEKFLVAEPGAVMISPSLSEGFDGKDDVARWQVILKIPFPPLQDSTVKAKMNAPGGDKWYIMQTLYEIQQMYGRVNRHEKDHGITFLFDGGFHNLMWRAQKLNVLQELPLTFAQALAMCKKFFFEEESSLFPKHESQIKGARLSPQEWLSGGTKD